MNCPFQFSLEFTGPDQQPLGQFPVSPDWVPAEEALRFEALRFGNDQPLSGSEIFLDPVWSEKGAPFVAGFSVTASCVPTVTIPVSYMRNEARKIESMLVEQDKLKKGDAYTFKTLAYAAARSPARAGSALFNIEEELVEPPFTERDIDELVALSATDDEALESAAPLRIFIPQAVLDETRGLGEAAGNMETGGLLIGHLHRDPAKPVVFLEVTAQIPAAHTSASTTSLSFNDDTWHAARAAIAIRNRGEQPVLWWHSHPSKWFCNETCPMEERLKCSMQRPFLSADDLLLHRTVFYKAWQAALLVNVADAGTTHTVWGWKEGGVRQLPFRVLDGAVHQPVRTIAPEEEPALA